MVCDISYSLNSFTGVIWGIIQGTIIRVIKRDFRGLDCSSYSVLGRGVRVSLKSRGRRAGHVNAHT